jgi:hypothetical protein
MQTRAAVAVFEAQASNEIVTGKVRSDRSMSRSFHDRILPPEGCVSVKAGST